MFHHRAIIGAALLLTGCAQKAPDVTVTADAAIDCDMCDAWSQTVEPFHIFGDVWYVGTAGLSSLLLTSETERHMLIDTGLPQSAPLIADNVRKLGFQVRDIGAVLISHAHYDHAGGAAALQRATGAIVVSSPADAPTLRDGRAQPDDPQYLYGDQFAFPPVADVFEIADQAGFTTGAHYPTARFTPGHTPGAISWTMRECETVDDSGKETCLNIVYADSVSAVSHPDYRFSDHPDVVAALRASIQRIRELECDILITPHPEQSGLLEKAARIGQTEGNPFVDRNACRDYADAQLARLETRLISENRN